MTFVWRSRRSSGTARCRVIGHAWVDSHYHAASGSGQFSSCIRCGTATTNLRARGKHRVAQA